MNAHAAKKISFLRKIPLFTRMSRKEIRQVEAIAREKEFTRGEMIFQEGEVGDSLYILVSGLIKIFRSSSGGRVKTLALLEPGDFFGEMAILDREIRSASARVLDDACLLVIHRRDFSGILRKASDIHFKIMETLCARLRNADAQIDMLSFQSVLGRLANTLLELAQKHGVRTPQGVMIKLELTHEDLSEMVGSAREMVTKIMNRFRRMRCILLEGRHIYITDQEKLRTWII